MKSKFTKLMAAFALLALLVPIGAWGQTRDQYSYTFMSKVFDANYQTKTLDGVAWTFAGTGGNYFGYDGTKGQQFGSGNSSFSSFTLSTSGITGTISQIKVNTSGANSIVGTLNVTVGGNAFGNSYTLTSTATEVTFDGSATGAIAFNYAQTSTKAIYIKSISITYSTDGHTTYTLTSVVTPAGTGTVELSETSLEEDETATATATANAHYTFTSWSIAGEGATISSTTDNPTTVTMGTANATITATFTEDPKYNITYNANYEGSTDEPVVVSDYADETMTIADYSTFSRTGYAMTSWNTQADGNGTTYNAGDSYTMTSAGLTLYAQWEESTEVVDYLDRAFTGVTEGATTYSSWSGKTGTSGAVYAGNSAGGNNSIQLRSTSNSGIISTTSGGKVKKVVVTWNSSTSNGRTLNVYGKNTAYTATSNLYDSNNQGTLLGTIVYGTSTELTISGDYEYVGLRSSSGAMYLSEINITWSTVQSTDPSITAGNVNITYDAEAGEIEYTVNNPVSGGVLTATTESDWLTIGSIGQTIPFTCGANPTSAERTATVTLTYTYNTTETVTKDVTITQAAAPIVYTSIPAIFAAATTTETNVLVTFNNWVVSGVSTNGKNIFVTDNNGNGFVIYYTSDMSGTFAAGNVLSGTAVSCTLKLYNGFAELLNVNATNLTITTGGTVTTADIAMAELTGVNTGALVHYENLTCSVDNNKYYLSDGTTTLQVFNSLYAFEALENGKSYNVTGVYQQYNTTKEILPRSAADIEEVVVAVPTITLVPDNPIYTQDGYQLEFAYYSHGGAIDIVQYENFQDELTFEDFYIQYYDANSQPIETPDWLTEPGAVVELIGEVLYLNVAVKYNNTGAERSCYFKVWAYNGTTKVYSDLVTVHQADKPVINANDIVLTHDATSGSIAYTISNPIANTSLTATLQEGIDWISNINVGETAVTFNTTANTGAIRTANITLTYKDTDNHTHATKDVTVTQIMPSVTGTIAFGNGDGRVMINSSDVTGKDDLDNTWTIHTEGTTSFTNNANTGFAQVGSSNNPATSIVFTTSLGAGTTITAIEAKFGGNNNTAGDINLFVDNTNVGEGALNGTADVTVHSTTTAVGNAITVTVSNIAKGVKCYYISYSYVASTAPYITAEAALPLAYDATSGSIAYEIGNPVEGGVLTATINDGSTIADLAIGTITDEAVPFACSANTATTEHTATITLTYKDANDQILATKEVILTQDRVPMQNVTMAFHPTAAMATIGIEAFTAPTLTINPVGLTVTYSSSNPTVATVDETTGEVTIGTSAGITEITATFDGNDAYYTASALYTLFVNADLNVPILTVDEEYITPTTAPVLWTPCASVTSYTLDLAPVAISESFEEGLIPEGWTKPETNVSIASGKGGDGDYCVAFKAKDAYLITPALNNPKAISFMYKRSSNTTDWSLDVSYANAPDASEWNNIGTIDDATTSWQTFSASLNVTGPVYIRLKDTRSSGTHERYIDLVQIAGEYTSQSVTATSYTFENLAAGATYYARVKGNDNYSNVVSFTTLPFTKEIAGYGNSEKDGYYLIASPVGVVTPTAANGFLTSDYDLYVFDESQNGAEWRNYEVMTEGDNPQHANFSTLEPGKGYLYASQTTTTIEFTGTPYVGDGTFTLSMTDNVQLSGWNLVGNPYATIASIDKTDFYVMNEAGNEIVTSKNNTIAPMQGVFVHADEDGEMVTFTPGNTDAVNQSITAQVSQNRGSVIDRVRVRFGEGRQLPKFMLNSDNTKLYIPQGKKDYAVVRSNGQGEMPVNFKAENNGTYTLSVNAENVEMTYLHLIDNMTGADIDLLQTPSYTFEARTSDYASRFRLVFDANSATENATETFAFFNGSEWQISNVGEATLQVVDMMGRVLSTETICGNAGVNINQAAGIYMLRLVNGDDVKVQKVVVR